MEMEMEYKQRYVTKRFQMKHNTKYILFREIDWDNYKNHHTVLVVMYEVIRTTEGRIITDIDIYQQCNGLRPIHEYAHGFKSLNTAKEWGTKKLQSLGSVQTWAN